MTTATIGENVRRVLDRAVLVTARTFDGPEECRTCGCSHTDGVEVHFRPFVCTCSTQSRPTEADPCREADFALVCAECIAFDAATD